MKKTLIILAVIGVAISAFGLVNYAFAHRTNPPFPNNPIGQERPDGQWIPREKIDPEVLEFLHEAMTAATSEVLGISGEELAESKEAGVPITELMEAAGLTAEEFRIQLDEAFTAAVEDGVSEEMLTQEQADKILNSKRRLWEFAKKNVRDRQPDAQRRIQEYTLSALSEAFSLTVDEFKAQLADGNTLLDLAEEDGLTIAEFNDLLEDAQGTALEQAVEDGVITLGQADEISERMENKPVNGLFPDFGKPQGSCNIGKNLHHGLRVPHPGW